MAFAQPFPLAAHHLQNGKTANVFGPDLAVRLICPECKDLIPNIVEEFGSGDLVCGTCGLILGDRVVDTRSEWRTFANDEGDDPSRVGAANDPLLDGENLDTMISFRDGHSGISRELQRAASRAQNSRSERNLAQAFRDISSWCDQFSLPKTISDIAKQLYKRSDEEKLLRGKSIEAVIAACIFIACRQAHVPRTFREMCNLTHVSKKSLGQCYKTLEKSFNLAAGAGSGPAANGKTPDPSTTMTDPKDLLSRYCNHLGLPHLVQAYATELIERGRTMADADGRSPISVASGAIYFTTQLLGIPMSMAELCAVAGISEGTVRLMYRIYYRSREVLVKKEWIESGKAKLERLPGTS